MGVLHEAASEEHASQENPERHAHVEEKSMDKHALQENPEEQADTSVVQLENT